MKVLGKGLLTGMTLQLALGPVFFYILNLTLQRSIFDGLAAVTAVTLVDYFYICLAILGLGKFLAQPRVKRVFGLLSPLVLLAFAVILIRGALAPGMMEEEIPQSLSLVQSFTSVFLLTLSSPLTILFFTSLFAAKAIENNYNKKELALFGIGAGLATLLFLSLSVLLFSFIGGRIPRVVIQGLNILVGILLSLYGIHRLIRYVKEWKKEFKKK